MAGTKKPSRNWKKQRSELFSSLPNVSIQDKLPPQGILLKPAVKYNIDDEAWLDRVDPATGSLLYVDAAPRPESRLTRSDVFESASSSSSSSISSLVSPEMSPSRHSLYQRSDSFLQLSHSPSLSEYRTSPQASKCRNSPSMSALDEKASQDGDKRRGKSPTKSPVDRTSAKVNQHNADSISLCSSLPEPSGSPYMTASFLSVPQGEQFGSRGLPLDENVACVTRVKIGLTQYHIGTKGGSPCSLEQLGIVPTRGPIPRKGHAIFASSRLSLRSHNRHFPGHSPVIVRDVAKGSPAAATQQLHQGDTILAVNGTCVDMSNVDSVLSGVIDEVQLMVRKHSLLLPPSPNPGSPSLSKLVAGSKVTLRSLSRTLQSLPHLLLYLTLDTREDDHPDMDILYRYPAEGGDRLLQTRGLFLTLSDIVGSIGHDSLSCSSLILDGVLVHLGYIQSGKELVLLALPANLASLYCVKLLVQEVQKTLELMFGSLASGFKKKEHHPFLDHLFSMFFQKHLAPLPLHCTSPLMGVASAPLLSLPQDLKLKLSTALTELDSIDRSSQPELMCVPSTYRLIGSCFFYQGALVCSHLSDSDLRCVVLFCNAHRLLELTAAESVNQIVIWRQVWLPSNDASTEEQTYLLHRGSTYILVVGMERVIVCMLLENWRSEVMGAAASLDTMRVESAHTLMTEMKAKGLLDGIEQRLCTPTPFPSVVMADIAMATMFSARHHRGSSLNVAASDSEEEPSSPANKIATASRFKYQRKDLSLPLSLSLVAGHPKASLQGLPRPSDMLNAGAETIVLHYIDLHAERGVIVCPIHTAPIGSVHSEVLECFVEVCGSIRQTLWRRRRRCGRGGAAEDECSESDDGDEEEEDGEVGHQNLPPSTVVPSAPPPPPNPSVIEHGVLLSCTMDQSSADKHRAPSFSYWVVGRLFPDTGRELYVCFVDNTSQNIIEMAFRLAFGTTH